MRRHLLAIAGILTVATGCDNVAWGGVEFELMPPPASEVGATDVADADAALPELAGPLLLAGTREGERGTFVVVGEVLGDSLRSPDATAEAAERIGRLTAEGSRWTLFAEGVRVGTFTSDATSQAGEYCPARPALTGTVELVPTASAAERFLALPVDVGLGRAYDAFRSVQDVYDQRVATLTWAGEAIPRFQATWPADGLVEARQDIRAFQTAGGSGPAVAATFMFRDQLAVGPTGGGSYSLFVLGTRVGDTYREDFAWYRAADAEGKGAPRYFDHLDWDGDGDAEILLDVFGSSRRWFAALGQRGGRWVRTYQDACGPGTATGG
jgi:hypothetical protein